MFNYTNDIIDTYGNWYYNTQLKDTYIYYLIETYFNINNYLNKKDVCIISEFQNIDINYIQNKYKVIIFLNGECTDINYLLKKFNYINVFITFQNNSSIINKTNNIIYVIKSYLPLYWKYNNYIELNKTFHDKFLNKINNINDYNFCSVVISHNNNAKHTWLESNKNYCKQYNKSLVNERINFYNYLYSKNNDIITGGLMFNKFITNKYNLLNKSIFNLCFENCIYDDYITEKIFDSYYCGCIPIYCGSPNIDTIFNKNTFINCLENYKLKDFDKIYHEINNFNLTSIINNNIFNREYWFIDEQNRIKNELYNVLDNLLIK